MASGNRLGAEAAAEVARAGGNAVDACLASAVMAWVAEPFFASVAGSGFIAVRTPDGTVEIIDGNNAMPIGTPAEPGQGSDRVFLDYSNGMYTYVGAGAVGVPGVLAAVHTAWERHGRIEWPALFEAAIHAARDGFAFPKTSDYYLSVTYEAMWSRDPVATATFTRDGRLLREGETIVQSELADALSMIATKGPDAFYGGELGGEIIQVITERDGFMTLEDLRTYRAEIRNPIETEAFGWEIASNPPPAVGGAVLVHMLALLEGVDLTDPVQRMTAVVEAQRAAMGYRRERYEDPEGIAAAFQDALQSLRGRSSETTHSSSADADGYVCSLTESNGYGAAVVVRGILLNNSLGEEELNPLGVHRLPPGSRCHSNMTPTIARGPGITVGLGSPGADRIVSAIVQTLLRLAIDHESLQDAVAGPRAHLDARPDGELLCFELDLPGDQLPYTTRHFAEIHMYFGGLQAASVNDDGTVEAVFDPRRSGGVALV
ncbi:MAG TPA: gamma-glutamyltransferase [Actinomycetota bacterium]|nr:gamma-glutamyltransferase [Actinomycetota bacterium]